MQYASIEETPIPKYQAYTLQNYREIPQLAKLPGKERFAIEVVGNVLPFRVNRYVIDELIDWNRAPQDALFTLTFPHREMLLPHHFAEMASLLRRSADKQEVQAAANRIRSQLNPHPAG